MDASYPHLRFSTCVSLFYVSRYRLVAVVCGMAQAGGAGTQPRGAGVVAVVCGMSGLPVQLRGMAALHRMMIKLGAGRKRGERTERDDSQPGGSNSFTNVHNEVPFHRIVFLSCNLSERF